jgi:hypothetical protein
MKVKPAEIHMLVNPDILYESEGLDKKGEADVASNNDF